MLVVGRCVLLLFVVRNLSLRVVDCCLMFAVRCLLSAVCCWLLLLFVCLCLCLFVSAGLYVFLLFAV